MIDPLDSEILIETTTIGGAMEVRAVSAGDGLEVAFAAPISADLHDIQQLARWKLAYVRRRHAVDAAPTPPSGPRARGGILA